MNNALQLPAADKLMSRLFRRADGVVWDLMTGRIGIQTSEGIATLEGEGDSAQITINVMDQFGMGIPAFAQSTPSEAIKVGDIIFSGASDKPGWVIERKEPTETVKSIRFVLMRADGTRNTWTPPKVSMLGLESGVMVLRSLVSMLPGGNTGLASMQSMLMPMLMMGGDIDMDKMMPLMLMGQMGVTPTGEAAPAGANPMANMMPMLMMMQMMKSSGGGMSDLLGSGKKSSPFTPR